jgi:hypothetical protein
VTAPPTFGPFGQDLADGLAPHLELDEQNDHAGAHLLNAIALMWEPVDALIRDTDEGPGWSSIVDVERAPDEWLPWLGQLAGVRVTKGATADFQRDEVRRADGQSRGKVSTILATILPYLEGEKRLTFRERSKPGSSADEPYHVTARIISADLIAGQEAWAMAMIERRFHAALPAGIVGHLVFVDSRTYAEVDAENATYAEALADHPTYLDLLTLED